MTYEQAREYIDDLKPRGIVPGLTAVSRLLAALGSPQTGLRCIHIAGTNGKGSVSAFLESILLSDGKSVCRFSSPAVGDYMEMFTYNSLSISEDLYTASVTDIRAALPALEAEGIFPTSFEAETTTAFLMFARLAPDYAIIECGMGGELDATNVIVSPAAAVITPISHDHSAFLGNSIAEIAENKAGIIKPQTTVISAPQPQEAADVIYKAAAEKNAALRCSESATDVTYEQSSTSFIYMGEKYKIKMLGAYQPQNAALAIEAAATLGISPAVIHTGLAAAWLPYRFERIGKYILDGAHNEGAAREMARSLEIYTRPETTAFICGCFRDKDYKKTAELTATNTSAVYCIKPPTERGLESAELCRAFKNAGANAYDCGSMSAAISAAEKGGHENIVVFGSLSILKEAKEIITGMEAHHGQSE